MGHQPSLSIQDLAAQIMAVSTSPVAAGASAFPNRRLLTLSVHCAARCSDRSLAKESLLCYRFRRRTGMRVQQAAMKSTLSCCGIF